ncbi:MAG: accessory factor UbiK family protein [Gammaproteobacteria bacterium]|nr:MAG: accessory factor UbiK family protein [Gammaproteobacteria bacterium]
MSKANLLKDIASQLTEALPTHLGTFKKDIERIIAKSFAKFDLVTREEFDIQTKVLARTRKKLEDMEIQLKEIEKLLREKKRKS